MTRPRQIQTFSHCNVGWAKNYGNERRKGVRAILEKDGPDEGIYSPFIRAI